MKQLIGKFKTSVGCDSFRLKYRAKFFRSGDNVLCNLEVRGVIAKEKSTYKEKAYGYAILCSGDKFDPKLGAKIALGRAVKSLIEPTFLEERKAIYDAFESAFEKEPYESHFEESALQKILRDSYQKHSEEAIKKAKAHFKGEA